MCGARLCPLHDDHEAQDWTELVGWATYETGRSGSAAHCPSRRVTKEGRVSGRKKKERKTVFWKTTKAGPFQKSFHTFHAFLPSFSLPLLLLLFSSSSFFFLRVDVVFRDLYWVLISLLGGSFSFLSFSLCFRLNLHRGGQRQRDGRGTQFLGRTCC